MTNAIKPKADAGLSKSKTPAKRKAASPRPVVMMGGRLIGPSLADPELKAAVDRASRSLTPNRAAALKYFRKLGILTPTGKLTKRAGG